MAIFHLILYQTIGKLFKINFKVIDKTYSGSVTAGNSINLLYGFNFEGSFYSTGVVGQFMHFSEKPTLNNYLSATSQVGKMGYTGLVDGDPGNHLHYQLRSIMMLHIKLLSYFLSPYVLENHESNAVYK